ncbi:hypothetical protein [Bosea sp. FBZP-16]|uniref:hypothetical protein n=1 Tax=Bosea sp. FBZP-16 TaxID=2065382 RepID=UPI000C31B20E|nr:hypothetical protein [Bosea sp. FBZP-16]
MLVKMLVGISGPFYTLDPGDEFHFPDDEASRLVEAGFAVTVAVAPTIETATVDTSGTEKRRGRPRKQDNVVSADGDSTGE